MPQLITSVRAPRVAAARRLTKRAFRAADGAFLVEGPQAVREALRDPRALVRELFITDEAARRHPELVEPAERAGEVWRVSAGVMAALSGTVTPQGMVAVARRCDVGLAAALDPATRARARAGSGEAPVLVVLLAAVRDPGNAGTVLRVADAAGADAVVMTDASVDVYNGKCVRASAGSLFHLPLVVGVPVAEAVTAVAAAGLRVLAADAAGTDDLDTLADTGALAAPTAWLFGNEAWGLPVRVSDLADRVVRVPIHGRAESLNLGAAAAVCLYASARAQRAAGPPHDPGPGRVRQV